MRMGRGDGPRTAPGTHNRACCQDRKRTLVALAEAPHTHKARGIIANITIEQAGRSECSGCAWTRVKVTLLSRYFRHPSRGDYFGYVEYSQRAVRRHSRTSEDGPGGLLMMRESSGMVSLCPMFPEGPTKMAGCRRWELADACAPKRAGVVRCHPTMGSTCGSGSNSGWVSKDEAGECLW